MAKIENDKYYTPQDLAKYCVEKTKEVIGEDNITEYIEPSAGLGVFLDYLDKPYTAYDIEPESNKVTKQDWLSLDLDYKQGRCVIGNPPFGSKNTLSVKFFKKSVQLCDYIAFILPISQLNNNQQMYEFDLIHSEDLGLRHYSDRDLHCCFNIYKRPKDGLNKKNDYKLKDVVIKENRRTGQQIDGGNYDIGICSFGSGIIGRIPTYIEVLNELYRITKDESYCFYVHKERIVKNEIISPIEWIKKTNWKISQTVVLDMSATPNVDKRRFFPVHEYIYVLCKSKDSKLHNDKCLTSVWKVKKTPRKISGHPATFDYNIPYECILASTKENDIVLDCYAGTGTTLCAATLTNRHYIGFEIDEHYIDLCNENLNSL